MIGPKEPPPEALESSTPRPAALEPPAEATAVLRDRFGFSGFRPGQAEVVAAAAAGKDVLCVMPTGAGKSLCFQIPALLSDGVTLVVSPLIALMKDQVDGLVRRGVRAAAVHSMVSLEEQDAAMDDAVAGDLRLLYVAPERFKSERFRARLASVRVARVAVDEAHCISQWGHDFRPDYRRLGPALAAMGSPPVIALTATAPTDVQDDICAQLSLREPARFVKGIVRENLAFEVVSLRDRGEKDLALFARVRRAGASLVYCATRKQVDRLHGELKKRALDPLRYHAGLSEEERSAAQEAFLSGSARLLVATNAFGMGVDRPDVRRVIHFDIPRTVEAYVQEAGRAGRDGLPAECTLLYHPADLHIQRWFLEAANPSREVVAEVCRVLVEAGERRVELTHDDIAERMRVRVAASGVGAALAVLDRAAVVRRGRRGENRARITILPPAVDLFAQAPVPPGLGRLLLWLGKRLDVGVEGTLDLEEAADLLGHQEETVRRGLTRLQDLGRIVYVPPFRGRATEIRDVASPADLLAGIDFAALDEKRAREERKLDQMTGYATAPGCRAAYLLAAFGDPAAAPCGRCDACRQAAATGGTPTPPSAAEREVCLRVLEAVGAHDGRFGFRRIAEHLHGSRAQGVAGGRLSRGPTYGALAGLPRARVEDWVHRLHDAGLLSLVAKRLADSDRPVHLVGLSTTGKTALASGVLPAVRVPRRRAPSKH